MNTRKITCLLIGCLWMITPIAAILIDEWVTGHRMSVYMYIFLVVIFVIFTCLFYGIWRSIIRIDRLKKTKEDFELCHRGMEDNAAEVTGASSDTDMPVAGLLADRDPFDLFAREYADFADRLRVLVPTITGSEEKLCILIRAKKRNKEIAQILHIDENTVYTQRYRIKRKLPLPEGVTMDEWIRQIG